jgi:hypothetical protein
MVMLLCDTALTQSCSSPFDTLEIPAPVPQVWGRGMVTLVGDAAHLMKPDGQGMNCSVRCTCCAAVHSQPAGISCMPGSGSVALLHAAGGMLAG